MCCMPGAFSRSRSSSLAFVWYQLLRDRALPTVAVCLRPLQTSEELEQTRAHAVGIAAKLRESREAEAAHRQRVAALQAAGLNQQPLAPRQLPTANPSQHVKFADGEGDTGLGDEENRGAEGPGDEGGAQENVDLVAAQETIASQASRIAELEALLTEIMSKPVPVPRGPNADGPEQQALVAARDSARDEALAIKVGIMRRGMGP